MSFGLVVRNPGMEMVIDSDHPGLYCTGQGQVIEHTLPSGNPATQAGRKAGYSKHRVYSPNGKPMIAVELPLGYAVGIYGAVEVAPGVWDFKIHCGSNFEDSSGIETTEYLPLVWGFAPLAINAAANGWGAALYSADGHLTWDLSHPYPLWPRARAAGPEGRFDIPTLTRPAMVGWSGTHVWYDVEYAVHTYGVDEWLGCVVRASPNLLVHTRKLVSRNRYFDNIGGQHFADGDVGDLSCFLIDSITLP